MFWEGWRYLSEGIKRGKALVYLTTEMVVLPKVVRVQCEVTYEESKRHQQRQPFLYVNRFVCEGER